MSTAAKNVTGASEENSGDIAMDEGARQVTSVGPDGGGEGRIGRVLLALVDKIEHLRGQARAKKSLLHAHGEPDPAPATRALPDFSRLPKRVHVHEERRPFGGDMQSAKGREEMAKLAENLISTKADFHALKTALRLARQAEVTTAAAAGGPDAEVALDPEERKHLAALLAEQNDLSLAILDLENQRLEALLKLQASNQQRVDAFASFGLNEDGEEAGEEDMDVAEAEGDQQDENRGSEAELRARVTRKKTALKKEEAKLDQMRIMLQKLLFASSPGNLDEAERDQHREMMLKCGSDLDDLRRPHVRSAAQPE